MSAADAPAFGPDARIGILGAGSWGTALAVQLAHQDHSVTLWSRRRDLAEELESSRHNSAYLPDIEIPAGVRVTDDLHSLRDCALVLVVVPSQGFREVVRRLLAVTPANRHVTLVSATKGIEAETGARMSEVCFEEGVKADREVSFAVLSGPTFAQELARGLATLAVIASEDETLATRVREKLSSPSLRLYSSADVVGVELGGTSKNVIAIASGVVSGLGLGQNTQAALITRGLHEITRLGVAYGGQARTFAGLAGLGDLVLTCTGGMSRNRQVGLDLAAGKTIEDIREASPMVAEGIVNTLSVSRLAARRSIEMPITAQMVAALYEQKSPQQVLEELMTRELKAESAL